MANRYFLNIGANWGDTANWSDTSGGTGGFSVPTNVDDVFFDANSGNCTVNASARVCKTLNFTGYTNTITMTNVITVSGSVTLVAAMTIAGASGLTINANATLTSNTKTWPNNITFSTDITITLADNFSINGLLTIINANNVTLNGSFTLNLAGGLTVTSLNTFIKGTGTPTLNLTGGAWTSAGQTRIDTNINGNITINNVVFSSATLKYISGSPTFTSSIQIATFSGTILDLSGITIPSFVITNTTATLISNLNVTNFLANSGNTTLNGFTCNISGNLTITQLGNQSGTTNFVLNGTGTWSHQSTGALLNNLTINTAGTITISGNVYYNTGTLTYTSGTITTTGSTLNVGANTIFIDCDKINFRTVIITAGTTQTFNKFFNGTASFPTRIQCATAGSTYVVTFQDTFEKIANNVKVSGCTVSRPGQLIINGANSNKGTNTGIRYINQSPNGLPKNSPPIPTQMTFGIGNISDPTTVIS